MVDQGQRARCEMCERTFMRGSVEVELPISLEEVVCLAKCRVLVWEASVNVECMRCDLGVNE